LNFQIPKEGWLIIMANGIADVGHHITLQDPVVTDQNHNNNGITNELPIRALYPGEGRDVGDFLTADQAELIARGRHDNLPPGLVRAVRYRLGGSPEAGRLFSETNRVTAGDGEAEAARWSFQVNGGQKELNLQLALEQNLTASGDFRLELYNQQNERWEEVAIQNVQQSPLALQATATIDTNLEAFIDVNNEVQGRVVVTEGEIGINADSLAVIQPDAATAATVTPVAGIVLGAGEFYNLKNEETGEVASVTVGKGGELIISTAINTNAETMNVSSGSEIAVKTDNGEYRVAAGTGNDWTISRPDGAADIYLQDISHGNDFINIKNSDTGEESCFYLGCLIQSDTLRTDGDDVFTVNVKSGDRVHIAGNGDRDSYVVTAGSEETASWNVARDEEGWGWYFYTGGETITFENADTGDQASFRVSADGTMVALDEAAADADTVYKLHTGDLFNFQVGGHGNPVNLSMRVGWDGDWQINARQQDYTHTIEVGDGDIVRVQERWDKNQASYYQLGADGELRKTTEKPVGTDEMTTVYVQQGDTVKLRHAGSGKTLETIEGESLREKPVVSAPGTLDEGFQGVIEQHVQVTLNLNINIETRVTLNRNVQESIEVNGNADWVKTLDDWQSEGKLTSEDLQEILKEMQKTLKMIRSGLKEYRNKMKQFFKDFAGQDVDQIKQFLHQAQEELLENFSEPLQKYLRQNMSVTTAARGQVLNEMQSLA